MTHLEDGHLAALRVGKRNISQLHFALDGVQTLPFLTAVDAWLALDDLKHTLGGGTALGEVGKRLLRLGHAKGTQHDGKKDLMRIGIVVVQQVCMVAGCCTPHTQRLAMRA